MVDFQNTKKLLMSEINIIPFTDIVLVILIVFIITTPILIESSIKVKLPQTQLNSPATQKKDKVTITINSNSEVYVNDKPVNNFKILKSMLIKLEVNNKSVIIEADKDTNYGLVATVLSIAQDLGANNLQLLVQNKPE